MKQRLLRQFSVVLAALAFTAQAAKAQYPYWKPVKGLVNEFSTNKTAVTSGADAGRTPGGRYNSSFTNVNGTLYLFAGYRGNLTNDVWKFDPSTYVWTPVATTGTAPAGRHSQAAAANGSDLYIFGGINLTNDLYKLNTTTNAWTTLRTNSGTTAVTTGDPATFTPGGKTSAAMWQVNGMLYLFGGRYGVTGSSQDNRNDFWQYNITTDRWTLLGGTQTSNQAGTYGTKGVGSVNNIPTARNCAASWTIGDKLYLFGGNTTSASARLNDLWMYNTTSGEWTWLTGSSTTGALAKYGTAGNFASDNTPGASAEAFAWAANGKLYLYGGGGFAASGSAGLLSDVWEFDPAQGTAGGQWRVLKGPQTNSNPGNPVYDAGNNATVLNTYGDGTYLPRARSAGSSVAIGNKMFLYGGYVGGSNDYNDVWLTDLDVTQSILPVSLISFTAVAYNSEVRLNWATASEQDNKEFVVSRSSDGSNFTELARVPGNGTSSARNNYQYTDGAPIKGISYYKLQQVDRSGVVKELGVKAVRFNTGARVVKVYPNPVRDKVMLLMTADLYERYSVTDADGKILLTGNVAAGANQLTIDLSALAAGTYRVRLEGVGGNSVSNVVKL